MRSSLSALSNLESEYRAPAPPHFHQELGGIAYSKHNLELTDREH